MTSVVAGVLSMVALGLILLFFVGAVRFMYNRSIWAAEMTWRRYKGRPVVSYDRYMHPRRPIP